MPSANFNIFLMADGSVKSIGNNASGQCGTGVASGNQLTPYTIPGLTGVKQIALGSTHAIFLMFDGTVKSIGANGSGQCGTGVGTTSQLTLYTIPGLTGVKQVACGASYTVFVLYDGTVRTIGLNTNGQCATGSVASPILTPYNPGLTNIKQAACSINATLFLTYDGTVKSVGSNNYGQCGTGGASGNQLTPYTIPGLTNVKQIVCGDNHNIFVMNDGTVKTGGLNNYGQCATGSSGGTVNTPYTTSLTNVKEASAGLGHSVFLMNDGTVKTIGKAGSGECGNGVTTTSSYTSLYTISGISNVKHVGCGTTHTILQLNDGSIRAFGANESGQCMTGTVVTPQAPIYTPTIDPVKSLWSIFIQLKYLLSQYSNYYSIKSAYYDTAGKTYIPLTLAGGTHPNTADINTFAFDEPSLLTTPQTINGETFKPIDKLLSKFQLQVYVPK